MGDRPARGRGPDSQEGGSRVGGCIRDSRGGDGTRKVDGSPQADASFEVRCEQHADLRHTSSTVKVMGSTGTSGGILARLPGRTLPSSAAIRSSTLASMIVRHTPVHAEIQTRFPGRALYAPLAQ